MRIFWHYTSLESAELILDVAGESELGFVVSNLESMNDQDEFEMHKTEAKKIFVLCFCNTDKEKIPMWYMYSNIEGLGVALGLTPGKMLNLIHTIDVIYPFVDRKIDRCHPLRCGIDFDLEVGEIVYKNPQEKSNYLVHGSWKDHVEPNENFERDNYFIKLYPWYYEDEFRIVIKLKQERDFKRLFLPVGEVKFKAIFGPGFEGDKDERMERIKNSKRIILHKSSVLKIKMNLIKRHIKAISEYIEKRVLEK